MTLRIRTLLSHSKWTAGNTALCVCVRERERKRERERERDSISTLREGKKTMTKDFMAGAVGGSYFDPQVPRVQGT